MVAKVTVFVGVMLAVAFIALVSVQVVIDQIILESAKSIHPDFKGLEKAIFSLPTATLNGTTEHLSRRTSTVGMTNTITEKLISSARPATTASTSVKITTESTTTSIRSTLGSTMKSVPMTSNATPTTTKSPTQLTSIAEKATTENIEVTPTSAKTTKAAEQLVTMNSSVTITTPKTSTTDLTEVSETAQTTRTLFERHNLTAMTAKPATEKLRVETTTTGILTIESAATKTDMATAAPMIPMVNTMTNMKTDADTVTKGELRLTATTTGPTSSKPTPTKAITKYISTIKPTTTTTMKPKQTVKKIATTTNEKVQTTSMSTSKAITSVLVTIPAIIDRRPTTYSSTPEELKTKGQATRKLSTKRPTSAF